VHHCIAGVRLLALHLIKPHAPPRVEATVKQLKLAHCSDRPQADDLWRESSVNIIEARDD
jgi:hypothetical protein